MEQIQEQIVDHTEAPLQEHVQLHTDFQIVHMPVPQIQEIPQEHLPERIAEQIVPERIEEQIDRSWNEHLLPAMEYIRPAYPVTDSSPNQPLPPAFTSFLERLTEQVVVPP